MAEGEFYAEVIVFYLTNFFERKKLDFVDAGVSVGDFFKFENVFFVIVKSRDYNLAQRGFYAFFVKMIEKS